MNLIVLPYVDNIDVPYVDNAYFSSKYNFFLHLYPVAIFIVSSQLPESIILHPLYPRHIYMSIIVKGLDESGSTVSTASLWFIHLFSVKEENKINMKPLPPDEPTFPLLWIYKFNFI